MVDAEADKEHNCGRFFHGEETNIKNDAGTHNKSHCYKDALRLELRAVSRPSNRKMRRSDLVRCAKRVKSLISLYFP